MSLDSKTPSNKKEEKNERREGERKGSREKVGKMKGEERKRRRKEGRKGREEGKEEGGWEKREGEISVSPGPHTPQSFLLSTSEPSSGVTSWKPCIVSVTAALTLTGTRAPEGNPERPWCSLSL